MTPKRPVAVAIALALVATMATSASPVSAATNIQCQGGPSHFSGFEKQSAANIALTAARATLDKQGAPLCLNPGIATTSASSWWIMITQGPASANDFIQYGFWNCQTWCNFGWPGGETGGQQHEYYERNNGNWDGNWRIDLGNPAAGAYTMRMFHQGGASPHWISRAAASSRPNIRTRSATGRCSERSSQSIPRRGIRVTRTAEAQATRSA